jgi:hypothetical protein
MLQFSYYSIFKYLRTQIAQTMKIPTSYSRKGFERIPLPAAFISVNTWRKFTKEVRLLLIITTIYIEKKGGIINKSK